VLAVLVAGTFAVLLVSVDELRRSAELERHSQEVLVAANHVERLVLDLETGLRGFVITGDDRFLEPWNLATAALPNQSGSLERLVADNPEQQARAKRITQAVTSYVEGYSARVLEGVRRTPSSARVETVIAQGKPLVDAIRNQFDGFQAAERRLSEVRHDVSEAAARRSVLATAAGIVGSALLIIVFSGYLARVIVRPVRAMASAAGLIAAGDLTARAAEVGVAEIGQLGRSFNEMAASVEKSQAELARIAEEQSALRRVATLVARGVPPAEVFGAVTEEVGRLLRADLAHLVGFEADGTASGIAAWSRGGEPLALPTHVSVEGASVTGSVFRTGRTSRMDTYGDAEGTIADRVRTMGLRSSVGSPLIVDGHLWGAIVVSSKGETPLPADTESRLVAFTELAATAISNAHASGELAASRARIVAAADDARRRIERDLHDGTQQRVVSLGLELRTIELAVPAELPELQKQVSEVADGLESLLEELREISRGIHPAILSEGGLVPALRALGRRSPIPVEVDLRSDARLPEQAEVTAYYVASEGLANAAKHAGASVATIMLEEQGHAFRLAIRDDGVGGADPAAGSGLVGLRDRVEALGGSMVLSSPVGQGTSMVIELPIAEG
jgi:signal transduction histidine kinase